MKALRIGRRRKAAAPSSPLELALAPALVEARWNVPDRFNFTQRVVEALASDPKRNAVTCLGRDGVIDPRSFLQLQEGAARWALYLRENGVGAGDSVLVLVGTSVGWLEVMLACLKIGAIAVPASPEIDAAELERWTSATGASFAVAERAAENRVTQMTFVPEVRYLDELPPLRRGAPPPEAPTHGTSSRDVALILATAGTTGAPKAVAHTHGATFAARVAAEHWLDAARGDIVWCTAGAGSAEVVWHALLGPWARGAEIVLHDGAFEPLERLDHIHRLGTTILCQSPAEYRALAELRELPRFRSPSLRRLVSTGDRLDPEVVHVFEETWGLTIHDGYGQAETGVVIGNGADGVHRRGTLGRALPGHYVAVVDDEGSELPVGIEGDLAVRGRPPTLFAGYWESPEETREAFTGDWYLTGDVAVLDEEGFLSFVGRASDLISGRGRAVAPYELERTLDSHESVGESAVVGVRDLQRGGHFARAFVVLDDGVEGSAELEAELRHHVEEILPQQHVPREIEFVDVLPRTASGKIKRLALRERPVARRPLWELPPTTEPELAPAAFVEPPASPSVAVEPPVEVPQAEIAEPVVEPVELPEAALQVEPEAVVEPPIVAAEHEAIVEPPAEAEPEGVVEPPAEPEPEPEALVDVRVELEPEQASEALVELEPEPAPEELVELEPEPEAAVEPPTAPAPEPEIEPEPELEPEPEALVEAEPKPAPEHLPEFGTAPETGSEVTATSEPSLDGAPPGDQEQGREPETPPAAAGPLPDYIVRAADDLPPLRVSPPDPEPEPELGPLPEFVVDPDRPRLRAAEPAPSDEQVEDPLRPDLGAMPSTGVPIPIGDAKPSKAQKPTRRASAKPPARRGRRWNGEPGDEPLEEAEWMQGLSSRLSAYSLSEEDAQAAEDAGEETAAPEDEQAS